VQVGFDSGDGARSRLDVFVRNPSLGTEEPTVRETSWTFRCGQTLLELSAIQAQNLADTDQISLGAVRDGFPLLPAIDVNEDGRLTVRELRQVRTNLAPFDRDRDGAIVAAELLPTIRVSFGLGPTVHRQLAAVRSVHSATATAADTPPEWFTRMDRNQDGDLTPREFLGGKDQFSKLDADQDGFVTIAEAKAGEE
jgi:hypothetical protein